MFFALVRVYKVDESEPGQPQEKRIPKMTLEKMVRKKKEEIE